MALRTLALIVCISLATTSAFGQQQATAPQGSIEGRTTSLDGQPLRKTNLTLRPLPAALGQGGGIGAGGQLAQPAAPYATTSDATGKFVFTGLEAGRYTLSADHTGYINTQYGTKRTSGGSTSGNPLINLADGQHMTGMNIELAPQSTISGKVTDEDGDPMPRIRVSAARKTYGIGALRFEMAGSATTGDNGDYHLTGLTAGRYYISFVPVRQGPLQAARRPASEASAPELGYATVYYPGSQDIDTAVALDVAEGQDKAGINIRMRQVPVFHARGSIGGDLPPPDPSMPPALAGRSVQIVMTPQGGAATIGLLGIQLINPDGSFDVGGLTPGVWTLSALRARAMLQTLGQTTVVISNRDVADIRLTARNPVDIAGIVRIVPEASTQPTPAAPAPQAQANNQSASQRAPVPAPVIHVILQAAEGNAMGSIATPAQVKDDGSFVLQNVPPLNYRVSANAPPGGYLKSATLNGVDALHAAIDMSSVGKLELIMSMTAAEIDGTVTTPDGLPAPDVIITVVPNPPRPGWSDLYRPARTRADGSFAVQGLTPGKYRVFAWEDIEPGAYFDPDYMKPFESLSTSVTVDDSDRKTVALAEISKAKAADVNRQAGR